MSEANNGFISKEEINQWQQKAFEKYGVQQESISNNCPAKQAIIESKQTSVINALREAFPELKFQEMSGLSVEKLLAVAISDLEN